MHWNDVCQLTLKDSSQGTGIERKGNGFGMLCVSAVHRSSGMHLVNFLLNSLVHEPSQY